MKELVVNFFNQLSPRCAFIIVALTLIAGIVIDQVPINTAMFLIACLISVTSVLEWMVPKWIFPDGNHPAPVKPQEPPQDPPQSAWLGTPAAYSFA